MMLMEDGGDSDVDDVGMFAYIFIAYSTVERLNINFRFFSPFYIHPYHKHNRT